ncbi:MAG: murein biosynthesis integral membrane protein MurJ [Chloroflexaceae bacterium]|nr:murein biosynthesis integral membrane protein MurJ [Chloroflexaceae bacterium]
MLSSLIVMGGYLLSRVSGLLREIVISAQFGTSAELGAYRAAFKVTDLLYMVIIGGALGSSFIPIFIQVWERDGKARAWQLASAVTTWALGILAVASALLWLTAPQLTAWFYGGQGFTLDTLELTTNLTRMFLLSPLLLGLGGLAMAALNAHERFTLPALAPALYNIGIIAGAVLLAPTLGIWGLAWGVIGGAACYLLIQIPSLVALGMRLRPTLGWGMGEVREVGVQMGPRVLGQAASQLSILVTAALTARLVLGAERLAGLDYAYQMMLLPYGIFSLSLATVAFPRLARLYSAGNRSEFDQSIRTTFGTILLLTLPATGVLLTLHVPLVRVLFQRGAFDATSLSYTTVALLGYATALPAFAASEILIRSFYAMQRTWIPVIVGVGQVLLNLSLGILALQLGGGVGALALAFSIANNIEAILLFGLLGRSLPGIWREPQLWRTVRSACAAS